MNTITVNDRTRPYRSLDVHESPSSGYESFSGTPEAHEHQAEAHATRHHHYDASAQSHEQHHRASRPSYVSYMTDSKAPGVSDDCRTNTRAPRIHNAARSANLRIAGRASAARRPLGRSDPSRAAPVYDWRTAVLLARCATACVCWRAREAASKTRCRAASFGLEMVFSL